MAKMDMSGDDSGVYNRQRGSYSSEENDDFNAEKSSQSKT